jgi:hypothetical protein
MHRAIAMTMQGNEWVTQEGFATAKRSEISKISNFRVKSLG